MENLPITRDLEEQLQTFVRKMTKRVNMLESLAAEQLALNRNLVPLTPVESRVLELYLDGNKSRVIADILKVTTSHVSRTLKRIESKVGKNRRLWIAYSAFKVE